MTDRSTDYAPAGHRARSSWAAGGIIFAAVLMMMAGSFQALAGLVALFQDSFYASTANYVFELDVTSWGWIHLLVGGLLVIAGLGVLSGNVAARIVGIGLAVLSAIANFLFIPHYPFWSLAIIAVDIYVIWALVAHGDELAD
jgi:hypothetical protein